MYAYLSKNKNNKKITKHLEKKQAKNNRMYAYFNMK